MIIGDATKRRQDRLDLEKRRKQKSLKSGSALPSPPEDFLDDHHLESEDVDDDLDSDDDSNDDEDDSDDELTHWVIPQHEYPKDAAAMAAAAAAAVTTKEPKENRPLSLAI